ncbi:release factor glutamine methyltransferase [Halogranum gelatinilyticum]|uniref:Release factor glutamine methyltransferase n=1 Tax=Halogranum gelatinilyticum TaxID=660521 RepID=A0A1G9T1U9_9EURY|nr:HemK2/MTQ2 family protein methyltransferase [Halogranum gelatinilyticum]SDM41661.1 release factor glutamine methyltransferase [Halogranum gelatinilyticum]
MTDEEQSSADGLADRRGMNVHVYQPAEDSGLLAQAAVEYPVSGTVLEVGTGSGWVSQQVQEKTDARVVGTDINPHACRQARERGVEAARANLLTPFRDGSLDAVLFNPPYLPTDPDNEWDDWMEHALSGGKSGRELIDPFLDDVGRVLAPDGVVLLLVSSLTGFDAVVKRAESQGFTVETAVQESYPFETLTVLALSE